MSNYVGSTDTNNYDSPDELGRKIDALVIGVNTTLKLLGSKASVEARSSRYEDDGAAMYCVEITLEPGIKFAAYTSSNRVGVKTFLQGFSLFADLVGGDYQMKPLSVAARKYARTSILGDIATAITLGPERHAESICRELGIELQETEKNAAQAILAQNTASASLQPIQKKKIFLDETESQEPAQSVVARNARLSMAGRRFYRGGRRG